MFEDLKETTDVWVEKVLGDYRDTIAGKLLMGLTKGVTKTGTDEATYWMGLIQTVRSILQSGIEMSVAYALKIVDPKDLDNKRELKVDLTIKATYVNELSQEVDRLEDLIAKNPTDSNSKYSRDILVQLRDQSFNDFKALAKANNIVLSSTGTPASSVGRAKHPHYN